MKKVIKVLALIGVSSALFSAGAASQHLAEKASANTNTETITLNKTYKKGFLSLKVTEYTVKGHKNIIITTHTRGRQFYQVGSNDDRQGRTKSGVTVAYGQDQKN